MCLVRTTSTVRNEFSKKYQSKHEFSTNNEHSKDEFSRKYQYSKNGFVKTIPVQ